jgi:hypothetical protein
MAEKVTFITDLALSEAAGFVVQSNKVAVPLTA